MIKYKLKHYPTGKGIVLDEKQLLFEINRDRSENWTDYNADDLKTKQGLLDALSLTDYDLLEISKVLN